MTGEGIVVSVEGVKARVRVVKASECACCSVKDACHTGSAGYKEITVINDHDAQVSDYVLFEAGAGAAILSAFLVWTLPIFFMFGGFLIVRLFAGGFWPVLGSFLFLGLAFLVLKFLNTLFSEKTFFYPKITRVIGKHTGDAVEPPEKNY